MNIKDIKEKILKPKNLWHIGAIVLFITISCIYFYPGLKGYSVNAGDVRNWAGMAQEVKDYRENGGEQILWTNSMFSGMPATQISMAYEGSQFVHFLRKAFSFWLPQPVNMLFAFFLSFYIMACVIKVKPLFSAFGAIAYGFSTYFIVIIEAGHNTKVLALGFAPLLIAGFILSYRRKKWLLGIALSALFMAMEIQVNHLQITYYFGFILIALGIVELVRYIKKEQLMQFLKISGALVLAYALAVLVNIGNIQGTAEYAEHTIRGGSDLAEFQVDTTENGEASMVESDGSLSIDYITNWSYGKGETFTLLVPNYKGGESSPIGSNPDNKKHIDEADPQYKPFVKQQWQYWGDQPFTSGPVYVGSFVFLLAIIALFYVKDKMKWALLVVTILAIGLSWGKNFLGLTELFVNIFPGYGSFRTVTMILVIVELAMPLLAVLFLQQLYKEREEILKNAKPFLLVSGGVLLLLFFMAIAPGTFNEFLSAREIDGLAAIEDPALIPQYESAFAELEVVRESIFTSDVWRSFLFVLLGAGAVYGFMRKMFNENVLGGILILFLLFDLVPVNKRYLSTDEKGKGYAQWQDSYKRLYPYSAGDAENAIYAMEIQDEPKLGTEIELALAEVREGFDEEMSGAEKQRILDWTKFRMLNRSTNYRVYEQNNLTSSSYASYFHKSIGGYHGAKLSRYQDLIEYQLQYNNKAVQSMLNMKYIISPTNDAAGNIGNSQLLSVNERAMGNVWFVKEVKVVENAMDEMDALNSNKTFRVEPLSVTPVFLDGKQMNGPVTLNGTERISFWNFQVGPDFQPQIDTVEIQMPYQQIQEGEKICYIRDSLGLQWVYANLVDSTFDRIITFEITGVLGFDPTKEVVVDKEFSSNFSKTSYSGDGSIEMTSYHPTELIYKSNSFSEQLAVFSEIYYPIGWTAAIDGKEVPISRVNYVLRALEVPSGEHEIKFTYDLASYHSSGIVAWSSTLGIVLLVLFSVYREVKAGKDKEEDTEAEVEEEPEADSRE